MYSYTGLDYAQNRYYASTYGRFNTPDPYQGSGGPGDPGSWNRYSYTKGDPVNHFDPTGRDDVPPPPDPEDWSPEAPPPDDYEGFGLVVMMPGCGYVVAYPGFQPSCSQAIAPPGFFDPPTAAAPPPQPTYTLTVDYRGVDVLGGLFAFGAGHGYLSETDSSQPGFTYVIEGQNQGGLLKAFYGVLGQGSYLFDNPSQNKPDCQKLFATGGNVIDPATLLQDLQNGTGSVGTIIFDDQPGEVVAAPGTIVNATTTPVTVNNYQTGQTFTEVTIELNDLAGSFVNGSTTRAC